MTLLTTKLHLPAARPGAVPRPQLLARLDEGLRRGRRLTLICAPAGYGKTTLAADWIRTLPTAVPLRYSVAWLSLDDSDNDPIRFLTYLAAALRQAGAPVEDPAPANLQISPTIQIESGVTVLLNALDAAGMPIVLAIDDYHLIHTQTIHDALEFFLDRLPPPSHLILLSRADPPLPIARLRARGQLTELRATDLRLDSHEVGTFLQQTAGLNLSPETVTTLAARTEGWAAGVQLAAVSLQNQSADEIPDFMEELTGSHRYIMDYLVEEVLERQPPAIQAFLLQTSILERLCGPLCDALIHSETAETLPADLASLQQTPSQTILEYLERANLFLIPLDRERRWYRYHHLFADLLLRRLAPAAQAPAWPTPAELHRRAGSWYTAQGLTNEAIGHLMEAREFSRAADLIEKVAADFLERGETITLMEWVAALPTAELDAHPLIRITNAWGLLLNLHPIREVEAALPPDIDESSPYYPQVAPLRAFRILFRGRLKEAAAMARQALDRLPPEQNFFHGVASWALSVSLIADDRAAGLKALEEIARNEKQSIGAVLALHNLGDLQVGQGILKSSQSIYEQALALSYDSHGRRLSIAGLPLNGLGELYREWNELETAERYLTEGIKLLRRWAEIMALDGYFSLAMLHQARGEFDAAQQLLEETMQLVRRFDIIDYNDAIVETNLAWLTLLRGDLAAAQRITEAWGLGDDYRADDLSEDGDPFTLRIRRREIPVLARLRLAQGRPAEAQIILERMLELLATRGERRQGLEARLLLALSLQAQGKTEAALETLAQTLAKAEPEGFIRLFLDEGPAMDELLKIYYKRRLQDHLTGPVTTDYIARLLAAFPSAAPPPAIPPSPHLPEPLNEREREILHLVVAGCSNPEIAEKLYLALPTVKWHLGHLYAKLNVKTRTQAVARARELGLI